MQEQKIKDWWERGYTITLPIAAATVTVFYNKESLLCDIYSDSSLEFGNKEKLRSRIENAKGHGRLLHVEEFYRKHFRVLIHLEDFADCEDEHLAVEMAEIAGVVDGVIRSIENSSRTIDGRGIDGTGSENRAYVAGDLYGAILENIMLMTASTFKVRDNQPLTIHRAGGFNTWLTMHIGAGAVAQYRALLGDPTQSFDEEDVAVVSKMLENPNLGGCSTRVKYKATTFEPQKVLYSILVLEKNLEQWFDGGGGHHFFTMVMHEFVHHVDRMDEKYDPNVLYGMRLQMFISLFTLLLVNHIAFTVTPNETLASIFKEGQE